MAKDKKKKEKKKKEKKTKEQSDTFSQLITKTKKGKVVAPAGVTLGQSIDRSGDKLFLGTDYREVLIPERTWEDILNDVEHWTPLPYTHGIEMELIIADDAGEYPPGEEMVYRMKEIVKEYRIIFDKKS
jgi:hypothetical protein